MIERLAIQPDQSEGLTIVLRVTTRTISFISGKLNRTRMISGAGRNPTLDLRVTFKTLQSPRA